MNDDKMPDSMNIIRRRLLALLLSGAVIGETATADGKENGTGSTRLDNPLLWAVAWKQTAAEYFALCHQAFNLARMRLELALQDREPGDRPLAVITDVDDTILHARSYWGYLINNDRGFFDDAAWDEWLPNNLLTVVPGSMGFFDFCKEQGVEVFYVTSRNQGERTYEYALQQLTDSGFPYADEEHLLLFTETSDKTPARRKIEESYEIALMLGDNLNDFRRDYYSKDVDQRMALMERDREDWGRKFILLPNPTDGHWVRAIFGDSEPAPTDENRRLLKAAATRLAWDG